MIARAAEARSHQNAGCVCWYDFLDMGNCSDDHILYTFLHLSPFRNVTYDFATSRIQRCRLLHHLLNLS